MGFEPATLWLRAAACKTTELYPSPPPSGTQHTLFTQHLQNLPTTFRIYSPPSECTHHLQILPTTFRIYPPPSEFTHHLQKKSVLGPLDLFVRFLDFLLTPKTSSLTNMNFCQNRRVWCQTKVRKGTKRSSGLKTDFVGQKTRGGGRAETKNAGVKKFSIGPLPERAHVPTRPIGPIEHLGRLGFLGFLWALMGPVSWNSWPCAAQGLVSSVRAFQGP